MAECMLVTTMVLKVDLACCKCHKKIKKLLCKYPEIRDQTYDQKEGTVTITVVCCSPERIRQKLICKGGKTIKSIEIRKPKKPPIPPPEVSKPALVLNPVTGYPPMYPYGVCCKQCFGPCHCHHGYALAYDGWPSGCRCDKSYGCREYYTENYPSCTII